MTASLPSQDEYMEEVTALPGHQKDMLREKAKTDLYFLAKGILGYKDVNPRTHGQFCRFVESEPKLRRGELMPRGHLKTTIATIADSIRIALNDPDETRLLIAGETSTTAEKILSELKGHWEDNKLLRGLFPELIPPRMAGPGVQWSTTVASLNRSRRHKEATWNTIGVGGASIGSHYTRIKCDDLIGTEAFNSPTVMEAAIKWVSNIDALLVSAHTDIIDFVGTRWSRNDLYAYVMDHYGSRMSVFIREAIEDGEIIFPELHSWEEYKTLQEKTPHIWYAQYANNPISGGYTDFPVGALRTYTFDSTGQNVILEKDNTLIKWSINELDRVIRADPKGANPNTGDPAAICVDGVTPDDDIVLLDEWHGWVSPSDFVDKIFEKWKRWRPRVVGIEKAGQQSTAHYFERKAKAEKVYIRTEPLKPKNKNKIERIRNAIEPILASRRLYCLPSQTVFRRLIAEFPDTSPIDPLDIFAYGVEEGMWRKPLRQEDMEESRKVLKFVMRRYRNPRTGY